MNASTRHVQTQVPAVVHRRLRDLALDLDRPIGDLVSDAILLLLGWHGHADGLPRPTPPLSLPTTPATSNPDP